MGGVLGVALISVAIFLTLKHLNKGARVAPTPASKTSEVEKVRVSPREPVKAQRAVAEGQDGATKESGGADKGADSV